MNNRITICQPTLYEKPQKMRYFRPENFSFVQMPLIWGQNSNFLGQIFDDFVLFVRIISTGPISPAGRSSELG